jgi:hypothetical protein
MRAITMLVAGAMALAIAASPADAAKKRAKVAAAPKDPNEASFRFVRDALPVFIPGGGFIASQQAKMEKPAPKARKKHKGS